MYNYQNPMGYGMRNVGYEPQQPIQQSVPYTLKGRPVSSFEEARAAQIDFDGSLFVFPDIANNKIYTKQIGFNGAAAINVYELQEPQAQQQPYVTREEFNAFVAQLKEPQMQIVKEEPQEPKKTSTVSMF